MESVLYLFFLRKRRRTSPNRQDSQNIHIYNRYTYNIYIYIFTSEVKTKQNKK